jgi:hypothetical protein
MIESHVISLDIAKRLNEFVVKKESIFYWVYDEKKEVWECWFREHIADWEDKHLYLPAYTASELLEMLPSEIIIDHALTKYFHLTMIKRHNLYRVVYENSNDPRYAPIIYHGEEDELPQNALGGIYIYLLENGIVKAEDL